MNTSSVQSVFFLGNVCQPCHFIFKTVKQKKKKSGRIWNVQGIWDNKKNKLHILTKRGIHSHIFLTICTVVKMSKPFVNTMSFEEIRHSIDQHFIIMWITRNKNIEVIYCFPHSFEFSVVLLSWLSLFLDYWNLDLFLITENIQYILSLFVVNVAISSFFLMIWASVIFNTFKGSYYICAFNKYFTYPSWYFSVLF